ncbi:MAG: DegT/DnrJ/EryC1/StrS family aminotransferase [Ignavibacteria bacterium]|jgi:perosamine synthetase
MEWKIPLYKIYWDEEDIKSVTKVISSGAYWAGGKEIFDFERNLSEYFGKKYALTFNSGTSALHALMLAYDFKSGDKLIVPSFTFIATANSSLFVNSVPIFADIEEETFGLDCNSVKTIMDHNTSVRAVMPIHYGGTCCKDITGITELANDKKVILIEDAAESIGAKQAGKKAGTFGDSSMISFCGNKVITTGEGGVIITDSYDIYRRLNLIRSHGRDELESYFASSVSFDYITLGYNWRISSITAALGISQLKKLDKIINLRQNIVKYYNDKLKKINWIITPKFSEENVYQMYTIKVNNSLNSREKLRNYLTKKGVMTKIYFDPIHLTKFYRDKFGYNEGDFPITEKISKSVLTLPLYPSMTKEEQNYLIDSIIEYNESGL